jgi:hypothetical protein
LRCGSLWPSNLGESEKIFELQRKDELSTLVGATHQLESCLNAPPSPGLLNISFFFEQACLFCGFGNGLRAMRFKQLTGILVNVCFLHFQSSHGANSRNSLEDISSRSSDIDLDQTVRLAASVVAMASVAGKRVRELHDRALLLLGFAGAFRRSELVALDIEDIEEVRSIAARRR